MTVRARWASLYDDGNFNALPAVGRFRTEGVLFGSGDRFLRSQRPRSKVGAVDVTAARRQVDMALEAGVNFIDTADAYGAGGSETVLGQVLQGRRDRVILATKARFPTGDGPNDAGSSRHHLVQACEASLRRLRTEHIDLYQLHEWDGQTPLEETLSALDLLVAGGQGALCRLFELRRMAGNEGIGSSRERLSGQVCEQPGLPFIARTLG